jgi:hypothetical protein
MKIIYFIVFNLLLNNCTEEGPSLSVRNILALGIIRNSIALGITGDGINFLSMPLTDSSSLKGKGKLEGIFREANLAYILDDPDLKNSVMLAYKDGSENPWKLFEYNADYKDLNNNGRPDPGDRGYHFPASTMKTFNSIIALERAKQYDFKINDSMIIKDHRGDDNPINNFTSPSSKSIDYIGEGRSFADYDENGNLVLSSNFITTNATAPTPFSFGGGDVYSAQLNLNCLYDDFSYPGPYDGLNSSYTAKGSLAQILTYVHSVSNNEAAGYTIGIAGWENINERYKTMGFNNVRQNRYFGALALSNFSQGCSGDAIDNSLLTVKGIKTLHTLGGYRQVWSPPYTVERTGKSTLNIRAIYPTRSWYATDSWDATEANNFASSRDFIELWRRIVDFDSLPSHQKFNTRSEDISFLRNISAKTPKELGVKYSSGSDYYDDYCKYFMKGLDKVYGKGKYLMYNKCGTAMGQFSDAGYIIKSGTDPTKYKRFVVYWNSYSSSINRLNLNFDQAKVQFYYDLGSYFIEAIINAAENNKL